MKLHTARKIIKISIKGLDKAQLLLELYNHALHKASPFHSLSFYNRLARGNGTIEEAQKLLAESVTPCHFDMISLGTGPRKVDIVFYENEIEITEYDKRHGQGLAQRIVDNLRASQTHATASVGGASQPNQAALRTGFRSHDYSKHPAYGNLEELKKMLEAAAIKNSNEPIAQKPEAESWATKHIAGLKDQIAFYEAALNNRNYVEQSAYTAPESRVTFTPVSQRLKNFIANKCSLPNQKRLTQAILGQQDRIKTLEKIVQGKSITLKECNALREIRHIAQDPQMSELYERIKTASNNQDTAEAEEKQEARAASPGPR